MASISQVSKPSNDQPVLETTPSNGDRRVAEVALPIVSSDSSSHPCHELQRWKIERGSVKLAELKASYVLAESKKDKESIRKILAFGALSDDPEIIRFVFETIYSTSILSEIKEDDAGPFLILCNNPQKAELALGIIRDYAEAGYFPAMLHLANYHFSINPSLRDGEAVHRIKKVVDYFLDEKNLFKLLDLPTEMLTKTLDFYLILKQRNEGILDGRRPLPFRWITTPRCYHQRDMVMALFGYCLEFGIGFERDIERALDYYYEGVGQNAFANERLGINFLKKDQEEAGIRFLKKASEYGLGRAQLTLGKLLYKRGGLREGVYWVEAAADQGIPEAINLLSVLKRTPLETPAFQANIDNE